MENETPRRTMLDAFFQTHDFLVAHASMPIRRLLMDEINWDDRLIAIKGGRGVGKTDFMLYRIKEVEQAYQEQYERELAALRTRRKPKPIRPCLYVNLNDFFFTQHTIVELASKFVKAGGQYLFLDQIFK